MPIIQCASVVTETINYYLHTESDILYIYIYIIYIYIYIYIYMCVCVCVCTIDASKSFDRVNVFVLFNLLRKRNSPPLYLRFPMYPYCNQRMRIRWNSLNSREFLLSNGVNREGYYRHCYSRYI